MKFIYRAVLAGVMMLVLLIYYFGFYNEESLPKMDYISDRFGEECEYQGTIYKEGQVFTQPCKECYCSFGQIECAEVHCHETKNTLGMDLIKRSIQVLIPTHVRVFPGTVAVMNSVLENTKSPVKFTLVQYEHNQFDEKHLRNWISGSGARFANYRIVPNNEDLFYTEGKFSEFFQQLRLIKKSQRDRFKKVIKEMKGNVTAALLVLSDLLPQEHKVVVLSSNVIVKSDIAQFFNLNMGEYKVGAINSCHGYCHYSTFFSDYFRDSILEPREIKPTECALSTGVVVANLDLWINTETQLNMYTLYLSLLKRSSEMWSLGQENVFLSSFLLQFAGRFYDLNNNWRICSLSPEHVPRAAQLEQAEAGYWTKQEPTKSGNTGS
eukprot:sb/3465677/